MDVILRGLYSILPSWLLLRQDNALLSRATLGWRLLASVFPAVLEVCPHHEAGGSFEESLVSTWSYIFVSIYMYIHIFIYIYV